MLKSFIMLTFRHGIIIMFFFKAEYYDPFYGHMMILYIYLKNKISMKKTSKNLTKLKMKLI